MEGSAAVARARMIRRVQFVRQGVAIEFEHGYVNAAIGRRFWEAVQREANPYDLAKLIPIVETEDNTVQD
jgi:hypothetical protein